MIEYLVPGLDEGLAMYVGVDESCRGSKKDSEIIAATFSIYSEDWKNTHRGMKRCSIHSAEEVLNYPGRDWRFTTRSGKNYKNVKENLTKVLPHLFNHYFQSLTWKDRIEEVYVGLDGEIFDLAMKELSRTIESLGDYRVIEVSSNIKKRVDSNGNLVKGYNSPPLVWWADGLASGLFRARKQGKDITKHRKYLKPLIGD